MQASHPDRRPLFEFGRILFEALLVLAGVLALTLGYMQIQQPVELFNGFDWDAVQYVTMAEQFRAGEPLSAQGPEYRRIGTAILAGSLILYSPLEAFYRIEIFCAVLGLMLLHLWARLHCRSVMLAIFFTVLATCTIWSPLRSSLFFVTGIEASTFLIIIASFLALDRYRRSQHYGWLALLCLLAAFGATVREACLLPAFAVPFIGNPIDWKRVFDLRLWRVVVWGARTFFAAQRLPLLLPLLCGFIGLQVVNAASSLNDQWNYLSALSTGLSNLGPLRLAASLFNALGPVMLVVLLRPKALADFYREHQWALVVTVMFLFMSWSAHGDERYFAWLLPIIIMLTSHSLESVLQGRRLLIFLSVALIPTAMAVRALFAVPLPADQTIQKPPLIEALGRFLPESWHYLDLIAYTSEPKTIAAVVAVNLLMGWLLWLAFDALSRSRA